MSANATLRIRRREKRSEMTAPARRRFVSPLRLRQLAWIPIAAGAVWAVNSYGTPHLRFEYEYAGSYDHPRYLRCDYVSWHRVRVRPLNGECPVFLFIRGGA